MKIRFYSILLVLFAVVSQPLLAQEQTQLNQKNTNGQKDGKWKGYYNDESVRYVGQFENDLPFGVFYHYYGDGKLQTKMIYRTPTVVFTSMFYSTGEKLAEGKYINKLKDSTWITFGAEDKVVEKGDYKMGKKVGVWRTYYLNGETSAEMNYVNDLKDGAYRIFYEDGKVKDSSNFKGGKLNGLSVIYDTDGNKILEGNYFKGEKDKDWIYYGENQKVEKVLKYENGVLKNPEDLKIILENLEKYSGNRKDVLEFEDLRGTINYE
ncbi:MAG: antitoxin component YwqK of YwqJK toxin-antitoxin module [Vicingaceae bacterium]|jgi:antitoxin component YwqK of YwqJK toxin-antitoxin module